MAVGKANFGGGARLIASGTSVCSAGGTLTVTGLTFKPIEIQAWIGTSTGGSGQGVLNGRVCLYYDDTLGNTGKGSVNIAYTGAGYSLNPYSSVTNTGFVCTGYNWNSATVTWIAIG